MRIQLNLATKPLETHRRFLVVAGLVGGAAGILFLSLGGHVYRVRKADAELRARTEQTRLEMSKLELERKDLEQFFSQSVNSKLSDRAAFLNTVIDARSFNWTQMFMDLERILPGGVRVVSIEPRQEKGRVEVKLTVGSTSDEAKLKFLRALEESKMFTHVELSSEHVPAQAAGGDRAIVELTVVYSGT
jgi:type IV pilus assembly protein PilN